MYICYIDESGTSSIPGNTSHFVLAGLSIPVTRWGSCDRDIRSIKRRFGLLDEEIHTAWMMRSYLEQSKIQDFHALSETDRRSAVERHRRGDLLRLQKANRLSQYRQAKKNYAKTQPYIHLTYAQRQQCIHEVADCVSNWGFARLFAECVDKVHFDPSRSRLSLDEHTFQQVASRFDRYLQITEKPGAQQENYGLLIHDNNPTVAKRHTEMMKTFHKAGTLWTDVTRIVETPLFVDSELTGMVQIADLCCYALRRFLENNETDLFDKVYKRADRVGDTVVGVRHFSADSCQCKICIAHAR